MAFILNLEDSPNIECLIFIASLGDLLLSHTTYRALTDTLTNTMSHALSGPHYTTDYHPLKTHYFFTFAFHSELYF